MILGIIRLLAVLLNFALISGANDSIDNEPICSKGFEIIPFLRGEPTQKNLRAKCYRFFNGKTTFEEAVNRCRRFRSTLATPKYPAEIKSLAHFVLKYRPHTRRYWVGLTDKEEEGVFKWSDDGEKLDTNFSSWTVTEPDSDPEKKTTIGEEQDCVKMAIWIFGKRSSAQFYDYHCNKYESFVCEKEPNFPFEPEVESIPETGRNETLFLPNATGDSSKEVDFIVPKNATISDGEMSDDENLYAGQNSTTLAMTLTAEYEGIEESAEPEMPIVNPSSKLLPEISDLPAMEIEIPVEPILENNGSGLQPPIQRSCALQCMSNHMRAACPLKYFPRLSSTKVTLNKEACRPRRNRTHLIVYTKLDSCGTVVENIPNDGKISFRNTIHVKTKGAGIVRNSKMVNDITELMILECRYPQQHSVSHSYNLGDGKPPVYKTQAEGEEFDHVMFLYKSEKYECPYGREDYPVVVSLSERIYLEVSLNAESQMMELHPITCFATPDANPYDSNNFVMMQDGCVEDDSFHIEVTENRKLSRMSVETFRFIGHFRQVYIHCKLLVCKINSESSPSCPYACDPNRRNRGRRESQDEEQSHKRREISSHSGMIKIVNETEYLKMTKNEDQPEDLLNREEHGKKEVALPQESSNEDGRNSGSRSKPTLVRLIVCFILAKIFPLGQKSRMVARGEMSLKSGF